VRVLAGILRVAIGFDRSHEGRVRSVEVALRRGKLVVRPVPAGDADLSLERYAADQRKDLLEAVLGLPVTIGS
jgi:exopolyphosphatase/guanosine-5'-triphosphate,3'-diphosphate pyrophosphatase